MIGKKITLILFLIIFASLLTAGFIFTSNFIEKRNSILSSLEKEGNSQDQPIKIPFSEDLGPAISSSDTAGKAIEAARKSGEAADCLKIEDERKAVSCVYALAEYLKNKNTCSAIKDATESAKCSDMAVYSQALSEGKLNLCSAVADSDLAKSCIANIIDTKKLNKDNCRLLAVREKGYCQAYLDFLNDSLVFSAAKSKEDCEAISGQSAKEQCLGNF
jgi:hypothetical protein